MEYTVPGTYIHVHEVFPGILLNLRLPCITHWNIVYRVIFMQI